MSLRNSVQNNAPDSSSYQLSPGQQSLWFIRHLSKEKSAYNINMAWYIRCRLDETLLLKSIQRLTEKFESLRTVFFKTDNGQLMQEVKPYSDIDFELTDATNWSEEKVASEIKKMAYAPFDLEQGPVSRWRLLRKSNNDYVLFFGIHHIATDYISILSILNELSSLIGNPEKRSHGILSLDPPESLVQSESLIQTENIVQPEGQTQSENREVRPSYRAFVEEHVIDRIKTQKVADYAQDNEIDKNYDRRIKRNQKQFSYWEKELKGKLSPLNFPSDRPRSGEQSFRGDMHVFKIPDETGTKLRLRAKEACVNLYTVYCAAFMLLLYRYSGQERVSVSTPVSLRERKYRETDGYFVNPVVLAADFSECDSISDLLSLINRKLYQALLNKELPFHRIAEAFWHVKDSSMAQVCQAMFNWIDPDSFYKKEQHPFSITTRGTIEWKIGDMIWEQCDLIKGQNDDLDLVLEIYHSEKNDLVHLQYNESLFEKESIRRVASNYLVILDSIAKSPDISPSEIEILCPSEKKLILGEWSNFGNHPAKEKCAHEWFEELVMLKGDSPAIIDGTEIISYKELNSQANRIARYLTSKGVGTDRPVGISMDKSIRAVTAIMGIFKAGVPYVPLDPSYPKDRLDFMVRDAGIELILTQSEYMRSIGLKSDRTICMDSEWDQIEKMRDENLDIHVGIRDLAYIIYTSGSTGLPKGVAIEHRGLSALIYSCSKLYTKEELSGVFSSTSMNFDISVMDFFSTLGNGGTLIISKNPLELPELPYRERVKLIVSAPSTISALIRIDGIPKSVTTIGLGGDVVKKSLVDAIYNLGHVKNVYNMYGPTEECVCATYFPIPPESELVRVIGKPLAKTEVYILDKNMQPVPIGVHGELYLGGAGLARGYFNRPELTSEKFVPDPVNTDCSGKRLYRTGDLVRLLHDGNIDFFGRADSQVKIRGFRIELEEIESSIAKYGDVSEAVVVTVEEKGGDRALHACIVGKPGKNLRQESIRNYLRERLPSYMVPGHISILDSMPLNSSGKIDRRALPEPARSNIEQEQETIYRKNAGKTATILSEIWMEVLDREEVDIYQNFFDLGGHSLLMVSMLSKIRSRFGEKIALEKIALIDLYRYPTISSLASFMDEKMDEKKDEKIGEKISAKISAKIDPGISDSMAETETEEKKISAESKIAIIGIACRFPGAQNRDQFWHNLINGVESISDWSDEEIEKSGVERELIRNPDYVKRSGFIKDIELFDAEFFNMTPGEAQITDPQHRIFMECAWEALEDAAVDINKYGRVTGIYAGCGFSGYHEHFISESAELKERFGDLSLMLGSSSDFLCSRVAYKMNLNGPAVNVQSACSTSMTAIHTACTALKNGECDIAIAGGVSLGSLKKGYLFKDGMIMSPTGSCRPFDIDAKGTVPSQGVGVVILKRLPDAISDNHSIYAVIAGSAINNDGAGRVGFTAPSIEGQAAVIEAACSNAKVAPDDISYIEAHGTGTKVGDPVEIAALTKVFDTKTRKESALIGSLKANIGHTDSAAGVAGVIKTALSIKNGIIPPSINFITPNRDINFEDSPFRINTELKKWPESDIPVRAGVSSFGLGGCNAHIVLEEYGEIADIDADLRTDYKKNLKADCITGFNTGLKSDFKTETNTDFKANFNTDLKTDIKKDDRDSENSDPYIFPISAKSPSALLKTAENLRQYISEHEEIELADVAYTLQTGRSQLGFREFVTSDSRERLIEKLTEIITHGDREITDLSEKDCTKQRYGRHEKRQTAQPPVIFMFTGQGAQYSSMGKELFDSVPLFRKKCLRCVGILKSIYSSNKGDGSINGGDGSNSSDYSDSGLYQIFRKNSPPWNVTDINRTWITQPALFIFEYALAKLLINIGIRPTCMIGHSLGEYVAACISGVFSLEDALRAVVSRAALMGSLPAGEMVSVGLSVSESEKLISGWKNLSIAASNTPSRSVISGPSSDMEEFRLRCENDKIACVTLRTSHAFHSAMLNPVLSEYRDIFDKRGIDLKAPTIPFISNLTGKLITDEMACSPDYWTAQMRNMVRFSDGLKTILEKEESCTFVEVGPGRVLSGFTLQHPETDRKFRVIPVIKGPRESAGDLDFFLNSIGAIWKSGYDIEWKNIFAAEKKRPMLCNLPSYPFEKKRFWIEKSQSVNRKISDTVLPAEQIDVRLTDLYQSEQKESKSQERKFEPVIQNVEALTPDDSDTILSTVIGIWKSYLGFSELGIDDDFFELGGDSLLAVIMLGRLAKKFGIEISGNILISNSTPGGLAAHIREKLNLISENSNATSDSSCGTASCTEPASAFGAASEIESGTESRKAAGATSDSTSRSTSGTASAVKPATASAIKPAIKSEKEKKREREKIVLLKNGSMEAPLFLCHPGAGHLYFYRDFAKSFRMQSAIYGVEAEGLDGQSKALDSIESIAIYHIEQIRSLKPEGPYRIGGSSFGGMVAFEVAQRLLRQGEKIELLYMVDTPTPGKQFHQVTGNGKILIQLFADIIDGDLSLEEAVMANESDPEHQFSLIVEKAGRTGRRDLIPSGFGLHVVEMVRKHVTAMRNYTPSPYDGFILFFRHGEEIKGYEKHPELSWIPLAGGGINIYTIPGNHFSMNSGENVKLITKNIERYLLDATEKQDTFSM